MATDLKSWIAETGVTAGYRRLATRCGVRWQTVQYWTRINRIPARHLAEAEAETGIPRQHLNPLPFQELAA
jgi:hypothetical protein